MVTRNGPRTDDDGARGGVVLFPNAKMQVSASNDAVLGPKGMVVLTLGSGRGGSLPKGFIDGGLARAGSTERMSTCPLLTVLCTLVPAWLSRGNVKFLVPFDWSTPAAEKHGAPPWRGRSAASCAWRRSVADAHKCVGL